MARSKRSCANPVFLKCLEEIQNELDPDSNPYKSYTKAIRSLRDYPEVLATPDSATDVKFIGPGIIKKLKEKLADFDGGSVGADRKGSPSSASSGAKKRGRPKKVAAEAYSPPASTSTSRAPPNQVRNPLPDPVTQTQAQPTIHNPAPGEDFLFSYLNEDGIPVQTREDAYIDMAALPNPGYKIQFPADHHLFTQYVSAPIKIVNRFVGYLPFDMADEFPHSTLDGNPPPMFNTYIQRAPSSSTNHGAHRARSDTLTRDPPAAFNAGVKRKASLSLKELMDEEAAGKRRASATLDPSRQASGTWRPQVTPVASSSSSRGGPSVSKDVDLPAKSHSAPLGRSKTMAMPPPPPPVASSSSRPLQRTESAPAFAAPAMVPPPTQTRGRERARPRLSHAIPPPAVDIDIEDPYASTDHVEFAPFQPRILRAGEYDIVLILDTREVKRQIDREHISDALKAKHILVETRDLKLGDVCWIAKRRNYVMHDEYDEVVLDAILERKRLDDLCGSIKNGHFHDQKFRLHNTAITNVFYLAEDFKLEHHKDTFGLQIDTALSSTQAVDGFMVRETKSLEDTINYYEGLHSQLIEAYRDQDLYIIPSEIIRRHSYMMFQKHLREREPNRSYLTTYKQFQTLNSKSGFTTVRETWSRMLLCVPGLSAEKVGAVVQKYPTPLSLYLAFREAEERQRVEESIPPEPSQGRRRKKDKFEARLLLEKLAGNSTRLIGQAVSTKIYDLFMHRRYTMDD